MVHQLTQRPNAPQSVVEGERDSRCAAEQIGGALGRWTRHEWRPRPAHPLASVVKVITHWEGRATALRERLFPDTSLELVIHLREPHRLMTPSGGRTLPTACLSGIQSRPAVIEAPPGPACTLCIRLHPSGAYTLLSQPLAPLGDRTVDLRDCVGPAAGALIASCESGMTAGERIEGAVAWLTERITRARLFDPRIRWAAAEIERFAGGVEMACLRERIGFTATRFADAFREQVGVTPKRYARIARFRGALTLLHRSTPPSLATAALTAGYYDQPHMNREFRTLAALTPREFTTAARAPEWISMAEPVP